MVEEQSQMFANEAGWVKMNVIRESTGMGDVI
jgi:hypothetical protein